MPAWAVVGSITTLENCTVGHGGGVVVAETPVRMPLLFTSADVAQNVPFGFVTCSVPMTPPASGKPTGLLIENAIVRGVVVVRPMREFEPTFVPALANVKDGTAVETPKVNVP